MSTILWSDSKPVSEIDLATRKNNRIPNAQAWELTNLDWKSSKDLEQRFTDRSVVQFVAGPCPVYNCHGLTFASRRTQVIPESAGFGQILSDDGYERVDDSNGVRPGDVIVYFEEDGSPSHSGVVVWVKTSVFGAVPFVWSKWGRGQEAIHHFATCPYFVENVQYFRLQEWQNEP